MLSVGDIFPNVRGRNVLRRRNISCLGVKKVLIPRLLINTEISSNLFIENLPNYLEKIANFKSLVLGNGSVCKHVPLDPSQGHGRCSWSVAYSRGPTSSSSVPYTRGHLSHLVSSYVSLEYLRVSFIQKSIHTKLIFI